MGGRFGELAADAVAPQIGRGDRRHAGRMVDAQIAEAKRIGVQGKAAALETAGLLTAAVPLAPAADRLYQGEQPQQ